MLTVNDVSAKNKQCKLPKQPTGKVRKLANSIVPILSKYNLQLKKSMPKKATPSGKIPWSSPSVDQIRNTPCKKLNVPTSEEMKNFIASKKNGEDRGTESTQVNGVDFKDESPALIAAFRQLTTSLDGFGSHENLANQKDIQKSYNIDPSCNKVECAVAKIWGEEMGTKILYLNLRHNFNASELAFENSSRFNKEELDDVLLALEDLPSHLIPLGKTNQRLTHYSRGYRPYGSNPKDIANAIIMLLDNWSERQGSTRQYLLFHEMSHNIAFKLNKMDEDPSWLEKSQWVKKGDSWFHGANACFPTRYSKEDPSEDFAETVAAYRYNSANFKARCPDKYNYVKKAVFKNIEYTSVEACSVSELTPSLATTPKEEHSEIKIYPLPEIMPLPPMTPLEATPETKEILDLQNNLGKLEIEIEPEESLPGL